MVTFTGMVGQWRNSVRVSLMIRRSITAMREGSQLSEISAT